MSVQLYSQQEKLRSKLQTGDGDLAQPFISKQPHAHLIDTSTCGVKRDGRLCAAQLTRLEVTDWKW